MKELSRTEISVGQIEVDLIRQKQMIQTPFNNKKWHSTNCTKLLGRDQPEWNTHGEQEGGDMWCKRDVQLVAGSNNATKRYTNQLPFHHLLLKFQQQ
jgi:hypothetical protein